MSAINDYLNGIKKKYPDTQAVREQIEELRDTLNLKCEEYVKQGQTEEEAEKAAVASIGEVSSLFQEISGNVYINHLRRNTAAIMFHLILFEIIAVLIVFRYITYDYFDLIFNIYGITFETFLPYLLVLLGMGVWFLIAYVIWKRNPKRIASVALGFKRIMIRSIIGWLVISVLAVLICIVYSGRLYDYGEPGTILAVSILVSIAGALNLPLGAFVYYRQLKGGFYDA